MVFQRRCSKSCRASPVGMSIILRMEIFGRCRVFFVYIFNKRVDIGFIFFDLIVEVSFVCNCSNVPVFKVRFTVYGSSFVLTSRWTCWSKWTSWWPCSSLTRNRPFEDIAFKGPSHSFLVKSLFLLAIVGGPYRI
jgi:hypothetical protein